MYVENLWSTIEHVKEMKYLRNYSTTDNDDYEWVQYNVIVVLDTRLSRHNQWWQW